MAGWVCCVAMSLVSAVAAEKDTIGIADQNHIADRLAPSLVRVEFSLQYDKGEAPAVRGCTRPCPECGRFHINDVEQLIREERPHETAGFLVAPTRLVTADPITQKRFLKGVRVCVGDRGVPAVISAYARHQNAICLELKEPLPETKPLLFVPSTSPPYLAVGYTLFEGAWTLSMDPMPLTVSADEFKRRFISAPFESLVVTRNGEPAALVMTDELPTDDSWKQSPEQWAQISSEELGRELDKLAKTSEAGLLRVSLRFRSPKAQGMSRYFRWYGDGEDDDAAERSVTGLLLDDRRILVLAELAPKVTARLEHIQAYLPGGRPVPAKFAGTLDEFGCFLAVLDSPVEGAVAFSDDNIMDCRNELLLSAEVRVQGETRTAYYGHERIVSFDIGRRRRVYPQIAGDANAFLFDLRGRLVALPVSARTPVSVKDDVGMSSPVLTPVALILETLADLPARLDPNNVPLSQKDENRLAWMGIELQGLNRDLARVNNVSDLTQDGQSGALVTYVHPGSPAEKAGIEAGFILLRLDIPGQPRPLEVKLNGDDSGEGFPWEHLEDMSPEYMDQMPTPWSSAENQFTRALTDIGSGKAYKAEFHHEGKLITKDFVVEQSPPHYDSAPRFKSEPLGMTVRDLTYEVRHYFQKSPDDPGVIVSKVEPGGKAAVAGILPYEIVTHVNDKPVSNVEAFENAVSDQAQLRLSVSRKSLGRQVKINMTAKSVRKSPTTQATQPSMGRKSEGGRVRDK